MIKLSLRIVLNGNHNIFPYIYKCTNTSIYLFIINLIYGFLKKGIFIMKNFKELLNKVNNLGSLETLTDDEIELLEDNASSIEEDNDNDIIDHCFKTPIGCIEVYGYEEDEDEESIYHIEKDSNVSYYVYCNDDLEGVNKDEYLSTLSDIEDELYFLTLDYNGNYYGECEQSFLERNNNWLDESGFEESLYDNFDDWKSDKLREHLKDDSNRYIDFLIYYSEGIENDVLDNLVYEHFQDYDEIDDEEYKDYKEEVDELYTQLNEIQRKLYNFKKNA